MHVTLYSEGRFIEGQSDGTEPEIDLTDGDLAGGDLSDPSPPRPSLAGSKSADQSQVLNDSQCTNTSLVSQSSGATLQEQYEEQCQELSSK